MKWGKTRKLRDPLKIMRTVPGKCIAGVRILKINHERVLTEANNVKGR